MSSGGPVRPATSTRSGSAVAGSAQMSTLPTVVCGSVGVTRSPAASRPAIRRDGSAATGSFPANARSRRARSGGSRSDARGSRAAAMPSTRVSWLASKSHRNSDGPTR